MKNGELNKDYIDQCRFAASRTRACILVLVIASILIFAAFWNSYQKSWTNLRITQLENSIKLRVWDIQPRNFVDDEEKSLYEQAKQFTILRNFTDSLTIIKVLEQLRAYQINEIINVHVPIIGIRIDVNDLGIASGIAFFVILLWLRSSLIRELHNMHIVIDEAKEINKLNECYHILAMQQLFNIPQIENHKRKKWERKIPIVLIFMPLFVQLVVLLNDIHSLAYAKSINVSFTYLNLAINMIFLVTIWIQVFSCKRLISNLNNIWDK
jgi:hypothetical protein